VLACLGGADGLVRSFLVAVLLLRNPQRVANSLRQSGAASLVPFMNRLGVIRWCRRPDVFIFLYQKIQFL
jgi:hypothetical protein